MPGPIRRRAVLGLALGMALTVAALAAGAAPATAGTSTPVRGESVLVFGGSGRLGSDVVRALLQSGCRVTVFARPTSDRTRLAGLDVRFIEGNALEEADVRRAFETSPFQIVVNALARSESDVSFYGTTGKLIAHWAKATGVRQVILHSSVGVGESEAIYPAERLDAMKPLMRSKGEAERALIDSGVTYTIIRNAILRDLPPGAADAARLFDDQHKFGPVSRVGLARLTRECIDNPACANRIFHAVDESMVVAR